MSAPPFELRNSFERPAYAYAPKLSHKPFKATLWKLCTLLVILHMLLDSSLAPACYSYHHTQSISQRTVMTYACPFLPPRDPTRTQLPTVVLHYRIALVVVAAYTAY